MTRFSFLLFNVLLVIVLYGIVYVTGATQAAITYTATFFTAPYVALNILLAFISMVRWFMSHNHDTAQEAVVFLHATWITVLLTIVAVKLLTLHVSGSFLSGLLHHSF